MSEEARRKQLVNDILRIHDCYAKSYSGVKDEYLELLEERRRMNVKPLSPIKESTVNEFKPMPFFTKDRGKIAGFLQGMSTGALEILRLDLEEAVNSYSYRTLYEKVKQYRLDSTRRGGKKRYFQWRAPRG